MKDSSMIFSGLNVASTLTFPLSTEYPNPWASGAGILYYKTNSALAFISAGSVEFGPEVTSSDKSLKVMLNSSDKVSERIEWLLFPAWVLCSKY